MRLVLLLLSALLLLSSATHAQEEDSEYGDFARNIIYLDLATYGLVGSVGLNYERMITPYFSVRGGVGAGFVFDTGTGVGGMVMVNFLTSEEESRWEFGLGGSLMQVTPLREGEKELRPYPAVTICYRIQPPDGGIFFRVGGGFVYYFGTPIMFGFGGTF